MARSLAIPSLSLVLVAAASLRADPDERPSRIDPRGSQASPADPLQVKDWPARIARHDPGSRDAAWAQPQFDDREWKTMTLPAHWEEAGLPDYDGVVWFRRTVELDAEDAGGEAILTLGAIDDMDVTWVNGVRVGGHEEAGHHFTPRVYQLPKDLLKVGRNLIAVRVLDHGWGGGIAETHGRMALKTRGGRHPLTGPWRYRPGASLAVLTDQGESAGGEVARPAAWDGGFELRDGDVVAFAGGSGMVKQFESGFLEALLTASTPHRVLFRDIAWQADTVYLQQRPRNFGTQRALLQRIHATVIVMNFGQMESLHGATRLSEFIAAYEGLLDEFDLQTPRIVLVPPHPFAKPPHPHLPDLSRHNGDVAAYAEAIRQLAERRGYLFADLAGFNPAGHTSDGVQLTAAGHRVWAEVVASQLLHKGTVYRRHLDPLREAIDHKNTLWRRHWRPSNWSFLYGNRQHVPSSHDHRPGQPRWFPREIDAIIPLIAEQEARIQSLRPQSP